MMPKKGRQATRMTPGFTGPYKGAPQQGTLFDVRAALPKTGEEIGPRGYSLNRSRQFHGLVQPRVGFGMGHGQVALHLQHRAIEPGEEATSGSHRTRPAVEPGEHPFGPASMLTKGQQTAETEHRERYRYDDEDDEPFRPKPSGRKGRDPYGRLAASMGRGRSKLVETLARSTVPAEHLHELGGISIQAQHPKRAGSYSGNAITMHVTGDSPDALQSGEKRWTPSDAPQWVKQKQQRGPTDPDTEMTLLHEIGHHRSAQMGTEHSEYRTPQERGREEAFADRYMMTHYREDPRTARWRGRADPREHSYLARGLEHQKDRFGETLGPSEYRRVLGRENVPLERPVYGKAAETERHERPMLDEPLAGSGRIFTRHLEGWTSPGDDPEKMRQGVYSKLAQITAGRVGAFRKEKAEVKRRWGVDRNLGRQFGES